MPESQRHATFRVLGGEYFGNTQDVAPENHTPAQNPFA